MSHDTLVRIIIFGSVIGLPLTIVVLGDMWRQYRPRQPKDGQ